MVLFEEKDAPVKPPHFTSVDSLRYGKGPSLPLSIELSNGLWIEPGTFKFNRGTIQNLRGHFKKLTGEFLNCKARIWP